MFTGIVVEARGERARACVCCIYPKYSGTLILTVLVLKFEGPCVCVLVGVCVWGGGGWGKG